MLDTDTKRRIDNCRDILVGKVPDPKSQVEQITIALIYKFMDDMDAEAEELGGERSFFKGGNAKYSWSKLMAPGMGGFDVLALYSDAIQKMNENSAIPVLFREIFKNAYLPYRDPETLRSFLKEIDGFTYDHSERLGDAFEYLLSVLGSQGEAGQFRTPRHIIDFMVEIIDPHKNDVILDPACGTAGFLISSYKHILKHNSKDYQSQFDREAYDEKNMPLESITLESPMRYKGDLLTPDERKRLATNIKGYDISPDMVRLSLVNMYLHGFAEPDIEEYDTLTSEENWNEFADVIFANPPFMSPKGGIKPHKRFSVQSARSEVLFVDYIAEHLTPAGRAAIVVPEGIIFQSGTAYKQLREMLVRNSLVAVISLPAGVFNPYSGVKTSILVLDRRLAKKIGSVLFVKIENDGFNLGAQRRPIVGGQLPSAVHNIIDWMNSVRTDKSFDTERFPNLLVVEKDRIGASSDWSLSRDKFQTGGKRASQYELVNLGDVVDILDSLRKPITKHLRESGQYPYYGATGVLDYVKDYIFDEPLVLVGEDGAKWAAGERTAYAINGKAWVNNHAHVLRPDRNRLLDTFLIELLNEMDLSPYITGVTVPKLNQEKLRGIQIPLPALEVQKVLVTRIEHCQKIIDGARQIVESYQPNIPIEADWPIVELGTICDNLDSRRVPVTQGDRKAGEYPYYGASGIVDWVNDYIFDEDLLLVSEDGANLLARSTPIAFSVSGKLWVNNHAHVLRFRELATQKYVELYINSISIECYVTGSAQPKLNQQALNSIAIPLPSLDIQRTIVAEIEKEQLLVHGNKELISLFEEKIRTIITRVWSEAS